MSLQTILNDILRREGGFVDDPADPGGATKYGVTLATLTAWRGGQVDREAVRDLGRDEARAILGELFVRRPRIDALPEMLQPALADAAVNHGPRRAVRLLQHVLNAVAPHGLAEDGLIGDATLAAAQAESVRLGRWLIAALVDERRRLYFSLTASRPEMVRFLDGWLARIAELDPAHTETA